MSKPHLVRAARGALFALGFLASATTVNAADPAEKYPDRPIQVVVGFPGGGALDIATRIVTNGLASNGLGPLVVINKPGASATIAAAQVARATPDGYTLLLAASANLGIAPWLYPKLTYDTDRDLIPVAQFAVSQNVIYASSSSGITTFKQLLDKIKATPGKFNYASPGAGTTAHLSFEMLKAKQGLFVVHVPFRGSPAAIMSVIANDLDIGVDAISPVIPFVKSGKVIPLAQTGDKRSASLPDVPTLAELGIQGMASGTYLGFAAPAQTPAPIVATWRDAIRRFLATPEAAQQFAQIGMDVRFLDEQAFGRAIRAEKQAWQSAVTYSGASGN